MRFCELRPPSSGYHRNGRDKHSKHNQGQLELEIRPLLTQQFHRVTANYNFHLHFWKTVTLTLKLFALHCREENRKQMDGGVRRWNYRRRDGQCLASFPAITLSPDVTLPRVSANSIFANLQPPSLLPGTPSLFSLDPFPILFKQTKLKPLKLIFFSQNVLLHSLVFAFSVDGITIWSAPWSRLRRPPLSYTQLNGH